MKKIYTLTFMLLLLFCLVGCTQCTLNKLIKGREINNVSVESISEIKGADIKIEELKQQPFYNNIMNAKLKSINVLPDQLPKWTLFLYNDTDEIEIKYIDALYAKYDESYYTIKCLDADIEAIDNYFTAHNYKYKLIVENEIPRIVEDLKDEYEAGEEVEIKYNRLSNILFTGLYAFLNGKLIGKVDESNTVKFIMPASDSVLTLSITDDNIYKLEVTDNFNLLVKPLKHYYKVGEKVVVTTKFLSGPRIDVELNNELLPMIQESYEEYEYKYEFTMPSFDSHLIILLNGLENKNEL